MSTAKNGHEMTTFARTSRTSARRTGCRRLRRGFTLVELMVVVAIVGVLAMLAMVGFKQYTRSAASGEAKALLQDIRGKEEAYRGEVLEYLGCDAAGGSAITVPNVGAAGDWYPAAPSTFADRKIAWDGFGGAEACFRRMSMRSSSPVRYAFAVGAGQPGAMAMGVPLTAPAADWPYAPGPNVQEPWFVAVAGADLDDDGVYSVIYVSSVQNSIGVISETE